MSRHFAFRFKVKNNEKESLFIFVHGEVDVSSLTKEIKRDVETYLAPERLYIIGFNIRSTSKRLSGNEFFKKEMDTWIGNSEENVLYLNVAYDGQIVLLSSSKPINFQDTLLSAGANEIFVRRKGLITCSESYHFEKPSGAHCDKFIRASNLFTSGVETAFLAIGLLKFFTANVKRIYVDTSSISFLLASAIQLYGNFDGDAPVIESFGSYSLKKNKHDFVEADNSLVFISATTSGGLRQEILNQTTFSETQLITLFYSNIASDKQCVYDISGAVGDGIYSVAQESCSLCKKGSKVINITGEQFLPETPKHELLLIRKPDFSQFRKEFFREFATREILLFERVSSTNEGCEHFYINVAKVLEEGMQEFKRSLEKQIRKYLSRDTDLLISLDDDDSKIFAKEINSLSDETLEILSLKDIKEGELNERRSVMVVASSITSGRKLLEVARHLRGIADSASITYMVGFSKLPTKSMSEQLRKDLTLGGYELVILRHCPMPRYRDEDQTPWDLEKKKLEEIATPDPLAQKNTKLSDLLGERLKLFEKDRIKENLFLPSPQGKPLKLRQTFAFWSDLGLDTERATQSDVYWTIQSLLHDLRVESEKGLSTSYHTTLISPVCFDRFNDGVIQACILRSAKPIELNYAVDEAYSRQIADIILSSLLNADSSQGEGGLEFLMAIWTERMNLKENHLKEIVDKKDIIANESIVFMLDEIAKLLN